MVEQHWIGVGLVDWGCSNSTGSEVAAATDIAAPEPLLELKTMTEVGVASKTRGQAVSGLGIVLVGVDR